MMSKLDELIQKYCSNGVKYKKLIDVADILYGFPCKSSNFNDNGKGMPIVRIRDICKGYSEIFTTEKIDTNYYIKNGDFLVGMDGNFNSGVWNGGTAILCQRTCKISPKINKNLVINGFLIHLLGPIFKKIERNKQSGTVKHLLAKDINSIKVPVPPLPVQEEIIRILDSFTKLDEALNEELIIRKKQYEYYRDSLLNFNEDVPVIKLKNLIKSSCSGATPKKSNASYYNNGTIPWIRTQDVKFNEIYSVEGIVTEKAVQETGVKWINKNCVIIAISGATAGRCAINKIKATTNQHCLNLEIDANKAMYKYVYYCVCSKYLELLSKKQGARGDLNSKIVLDTKIPVPSIDEQKRIVSILNKFEAIYNNLIPAEIEARKKQYEYYRDKILTFKELKQ